MIERLAWCSHWLHHHSAWPLSSVNQPNSFNWKLQVFNIHLCFISSYKIILNLLDLLSIIFSSTFLMVSLVYSFMTSLSSFAITNCFQGFIQFLEFVLFTILFKLSFFFVRFYPPDVSQQFHFLFDHYQNHPLYFPDVQQGLEHFNTLSSYSNKICSSFSVFISFIYRFSSGWNSEY